MKIAITGHRPDKLGGDYDLTSPLIKWIKDNIVGVLISHSDSIDTEYKERWVGHVKTRVPVGITVNDITGITGMALGIDTLFAQTCIEYNIPFIAAIPCLGQTSKWPQKSADLYWKIIGNQLCQTHHVTEEPYTKDCMDKRNKWMVDNCDLLIAVWNGSPGGTANCIKYAKKVGRKIIEINPTDYKS